jgi:hypothetical protein
MLGAEKRDKLESGRMKKQLDRRPAEGVESRMISDKSNVLATQRREFFCFENVDPCLHPPRAPRFFHGCV